MCWVKSRHVGDVWPWFSSMNMNRHLNSLSSPEIRLQIFLLTGDFKDLCWQNHQWLLKVQAILFISCIFNSVSKDSFIVKALVYQSSLTCLRRITFHPPSSIQFSLPPDCHLMICNDCGLAAGSCRIQNILSLSNNGNIIHWWPVVAQCSDICNSQMRLSWLIKVGSGAVSHLSAAASSLVRNR